MISQPAISLLTPSTRPTHLINPGLVIPWNLN